MKKKLCSVLGVEMGAFSTKGAIEKLLDSSRRKVKGYVCFVNAHSLVSAMESEVFQNVLNNSMLSLPDGMPIVWLMRFLGFKKQERVCGPDLMLRLCLECSKHDRKIFLYGNTKDTLEKLEKNLEALFPQLCVVGSISPPFRELSMEEKLQNTKSINESGADFVFVSLGCPKQEIWMANMAENIDGIMLGVGAAFDFHAGKINRAPVWMRTIGLEWLHRLLSEPKRLFRRYLVTNVLFFYYVLLQLVFKKKTTRN